VGTGPGQWAPPPPCLCFLPINAHHLLVGGLLWVLRNVTNFILFFVWLLPISSARHFLAASAGSPYAFANDFHALPPRPARPTLPFGPNCPLAQQTFPFRAEACQPYPILWAIYSDHLHLQISTSSQCQNVYIVPNTSISQSSISETPGDSKHTFQYWGDVSSVEETCLHIPDPRGRHFADERIC